MREIDRLWENFGNLLLQRLKSFLKGFRWLDKDKTGAFHQTEFIRASTEVCVQAGESAEDFKQAYELQRADASLLFKLPLDLKRLEKVVESRLSGDSKGSEVGVSLYNLVMRVVGLEDLELAALRRQVFSHYASVEACFQAHAEKEATNMDLNLEQPLRADDIHKSIYVHGSSLMPPLKVKVLSVASGEVYCQNPTFRVQSPTSLTTTMLTLLRMGPDTLRLQKKCAWKQLELSTTERDWVDFLFWVNTLGILLLGIEMSIGAVQ